VARFASALLPDVLSGSFDHWWSADLIYAGERRLANVPLLDVKLSEDGSANVQQSGSCVILWADDYGQSMAPRDISDAFAPFGAQLRVYSNVYAGPFSERVLYGIFEITNVPSAIDSGIQFGSQWLTVGSRIELELKELTAGLGEERFDVPTAPTILTSTWDEAARITGFQLVRSITDVPITRSIMYPESKLEAVGELFDLMLDAVPHMTADGALAARPNKWPASSRTLRYGDGGQIIDVGHAMSSEGVYNRVVVRASTAVTSALGEQTVQSVLAVAEIVGGPLRVRNTDGSVSPFRARTLYQSSEFVTTSAQAQAWADSTLATVSVPRSQTIPVTMTFDPTIERGDVVVLARRDSDPMTGRVATIARDSRGSQELTVELAP
jgi:hypothetical protein